MKRTFFLVLLTLALVLTGCASYRGGVANADQSSSGPTWERGTTGVSSGDGLSPMVTGSDVTPP